MTPLDKNRERVAPQIGPRSASDGTTRGARLFILIFHCTNGVFPTLDVCVDSPDNVHSLIDDF